METQVNEGLAFSTERIEIPISIDNRDYVLVEASGSAGAKYRNEIVASMILDSKGKPKGMGKIANADLLLLSLCLYKVNDEGKRELVALGAIQQLPHRVFKPLVDKLKQISELQDTEEEDELVKNEPSNSTDGCE